MEANLISRLRQCCRQPSVKATAGAAPISARTGAVDKRRTHFSTTTARANKSGGRQPAVVGKPNAVRRKSPTIRRRCDRRTRAAGVSPPWCRKPHLQRRPTFPNPARSPRHSRLSYHGWLTPAAPGCERGCCCGCAFCIRKSATHSHGWLTPAALGCHDERSSWGADATETDVLMAATGIAFAATGRHVTNAVLIAAHE